MSLGWLSESSVLPGQSKQLKVKSTATTEELDSAIFEKEQEVRRQGNILFNRNTISLGNEQKIFLENQKIAQRDEFIRQQIEKEKIKNKNILGKFSFIRKKHSIKFHPKNIKNILIINFKQMKKLKNMKQL